MPLYIGLDVGTQSCKAIIWNSNKSKVVARGRKSYEILPSKVPGRAEQNPSQWTEVRTPQLSSLSPLRLLLLCSPYFMLRGRSHSRLGRYCRGYM